MTGKVITACVVILIGGIAANVLRLTERAPEAGPDFSAIPYQIDGLSGNEERFSEASYDVLHADTTTLRYYTDDEGNPFWLFVAYFSSQKYGSQIHSPKHCLPGGGWKIEHLEPFTLRLSPNLTKQVNRLVIAEQGHQELMLYWYETRGGAIRGEFGLKWDLVVNSLLLRPTDAAIVRLNMPFAQGDNIEAATDKAATYLGKLYPAIARALPFDH